MLMATVKKKTAEERQSVSSTFRVVALARFRVNTGHCRTPVDSSSVTIIMICNIIGIRGRRIVDITIILLPPPFSRKSVIDKMLKIKFIIYNNNIIFFVPSAYINVIKHRHMHALIKYAKDILSKNAVTNHTIRKRLPKLFLRRTPSEIGKMIADPLT